MLSHERIWQAIDELALLNDLTPSGLAKRAGLDSTSFNKSKRFAADGRPRWPSTESLAKILSATGVSFDRFTALIGASADGAMTMIDGLETGLADGDHQAPYGGLTGGRTVHSIPVVGMAQAGTGGFFDDAGFPAGEGWDEVAFPGSDDINEHAYALEITGDSMLPLYRAGDRIIVAPGATVRRGDRVVVKTRDGEVMAKILKRKTSLEIELASVNPDHEDRMVPAADIDWIARIVWASQ